MCSSPQKPKRQAKCPCRAPDETQPGRAGTPPGCAPARTHPGRDRDGRDASRPGHRGVGSRSCEKSWGNLEPLRPFLIISSLRLDSLGPNRAPACPKSSERHLGPNFRLQPLPIQHQCYLNQTLYYYKTLTIKNQNFLICYQEQMTHCI